MLESLDDTLGGSPGQDELFVTDRLVSRKRRLTNFADLEPKTQWAIVGGTFSVALLAFGFSVAAFFVAGHNAKQPDEPKATATAVPSYEEPQQEQRARPQGDTTRLASAPRPGHATTSDEPAPAESAPAPVVKREAPTLLIAEVATDLSGVVSYRIVGDPKSRNNQEAVFPAFDAVITAVDGYKFEAEDGGERVFSRTSNAQSISVINASADRLLVSFKAEPSDAQLDRLIEPVKALATALGVEYVEGKWITGSWGSKDTARAFEFKNPAVLPPGKMK